MSVWRDHRYGQSRWPTFWWAAACLLLCEGHARAAFSPPAELTVATDVNYPPYLYRSEDGGIHGIVVDKWALWSQRTGVPVKVEGVDWLLAQKSVLNGSWDVLDPVSYTEERAKLYEFSLPYAPVDARVYFHRSISGINDVASMHGFTIGAKEGSACSNWLVGRGIETVHKYATSELLVKAAGNGEIRLFCMDSVTARYLLFKQGFADEFRETSPLYATNLHWAVKKGRGELFGFIQHGFDRITPAELAEIDARWVGNPLPFPVSRQFFAYAAIAGAAILGLGALLLGWNAMLRRRVAIKTTELNAAVEMLKADATRIQQLYNSAPCGYHSLDHDGFFVAVNDTELEWLGRAREELIGKQKFSDFLTPESAAVFARKYPVFLERGWIQDVEFDVVRKDGIIFTVLLSATVARDSANGNAVCSASLHDITARKYAEDEVRQLNAELEHRIEERTAQLSAANKELAAFSYSLSHDLRAPLRTIDGFSRLVIDGYARVLDERGRNYLQRVRRASQRTGLLIDEMLKLSRVSFADLNSAEIDLSRLAREIMTELARAQPERRFELVIADGLVANGDLGLVRIALENLLGNAWKYTATRPVARIEMERTRIGAEDVLFVRDNGVGFDMRYAGKLFEPFQRLHDAKEFEGTGIGLATVQRVISRHRGRVWAESELGKGATVFFTLGA